jgi:hypothetical protein
MSSNALTSAMLLTRADNWFSGLRLCFLLTYLGQISTTDLTLVAQLKVTITRSSLLHTFDSSPNFPVHRKLVREIERWQRPDATCHSLRKMFLHPINYLGIMKSRMTVRIIGRSSFRIQEEIFSSLHHP